MADNKMQFQQKLRGILEMAHGQKDRITTEEVEKYFEEETLTQAQMELVYDYLLSQKVVVSGYEKKGGTVIPAGQEDKLTGEEEEYLREYERDLQAFKSASEEEKKELFERARQRDALAKSRLIELYLPFVLEIAKEQHHPEVFLGDMVQEGNVSLMLALDLLPEKDEEAYLRQEIIQSMQALVEEHQETKKRDRRMVEKVGELDSSITKLTEEMGRKVTIEELAMFMDMTVEEIASVMQLAGEDIELGEADPGEVLKVPGAEEAGQETEEEEELSDFQKELLEGFDDMEYKPGK